MVTNCRLQTIPEESQELIAEADIDGGRYKINLTI